MNITIIQGELPETVKGMATKREQDYLVVVNSGASKDQQLKTIFHEITHIWRGDLDQDGGKVDALELSCREDIKRVARSILAE